MTGAELRTLRDSIGLSAEELARLVGVRDRTIRRWEAGEWTVPEPVAEQVRALDAQIERAVAGTVEALQDAQERAQEPPAEIVLVRYRTEDDLAKYRPDMAALPPSVHGALIDRVRLAAERLGVPVRIVWMDREDYEAWRGRRRDTEAMRAAWAAQTLAASAAQ